MAKKKTSIDAAQLKRLRESTGAPIMRVKKVLEEVLEDLPEDATPQALQAGEKKAEKILKAEAQKKVAKRSDRTTGQGVVQAYSHHSGKIVCVVELLCETDFVARNELFQALAKDLAMQIASMDPKDAKELVKQDFIKDPNKKVSDLVKDVIAKTGENIQIGRITRLELGKK